MSRFTRAPLRAYRIEKGGENLYRCPGCGAANKRGQAKSSGKIRAYLRCPRCQTPLRLRGRFRAAP